MHSSLRALALLSLLALPLTAQAQRPAGAAQAGGTISGVVVEAANGATIPAASIAIYTKADSSFLTGTITEDDGVFMLERLRPNTYYVRVSFIGFETQTFSDIEISRSNLAVDLGRVEMAEGAVLLDGATVEAERAFVEVGIDRTSYNTADQVVGQVGTATDLLQQIPSVEVDQDGGISLRGNANVAIQINGRPAPVSGAFLGVFLQQLPANQIERIEIIPNPSARYEPDGMSGIINIVLKQDAELGLSGSLSAGGGTQGDGNAGASINYGKGKWNATANYGLRLDSRPSSGTNLRETFTTNNIYGVPTILDQDSDGDRSGISHLVSTNVDYKLTPKGTVSSALVVSLRSNENEDIEITRLGQFGGSQTMFEQYNRIQDQEGDGVSLDARIGYDYVVESGRDELRTELSYDVSSGDDAERFRVDPFGSVGAPANAGPFEQSEEEFEQEGELRINWIRPAGDDAKFELGYQGKVELSDETSTLDSLNTGFRRVDSFDLTDQVHAGYLIYGRTMGQWAAQAGVRAEYQGQDFTFIQGAEDRSADISRFNAFPSAFLTFAPTDGQQFKASFSRRINRPRGRQLNPFPSLGDPFNIRVGNPGLDPEFTNAYELGYSAFSNKGSVSLTPFYRRTTGVIRRSSTFNPATEVNTSTFINLDTEESYGLEVITTLRVLGRGNVLLSLNGNRQVSDGTVDGESTGADAFTWGGRMSFNLPVRDGTDIQAFGFYRAPYDTEFGRISSFSLSNLSVRQRLMDNRLSVSLNLSDVFDSSGFSFNLGGIDANGAPTFNQEATRRWQGRNLSLSLIYAFGDQSNQNRRRNQGNQDRGDGGGGDEMF